MYPDPIRNRTLYIVARSGTYIRARPPALLIEHHGKPDHLFPLTRVRHIVCPIAALWDGAALQLVLKNQIPIEWHTGNGEHVARLHPAETPPPQHEAQLQHFLHGPARRARLENWQIAQRTRQLHRWLRRDDYDHAYIKEHAHSYQRHAIHPENLPGACKPLISVWLSAHLRDQKYPLRTATGAGDLFDLRDYLFAHVWADINFYARGHAAQTAHESIALQWAERWIRGNTGAVLSLISSFTQTIYGGSDQWHRTRNAPGSLPTTSATQPDFAKSIVG